jgi:subtilisin family serine protease
VGTAAGLQSGDVTDTNGHGTHVAGESALVKLHASYHWMYCGYDYSTKCTVMLLCWLRQRLPDVV